MNYMTIENYTQLLRNSSKVLMLIEDWMRGLDEDAISKQSSTEINARLKELKEELIKGFIE